MITNTKNRNIFTFTINDLFALIFHRDTCIQYPNYFNYFCYAKICYIFTKQLVNYLSIKVYFFKLH